MMSLRKAFTILLPTYCHYYNMSPVEAVAVGDEVCTTGYIMDKCKLQFIVIRYTVLYYILTSS